MTYWLPECGPCGSPPAQRNSGPRTRSRPRRTSRLTWSSGSDQWGGSRWRRWWDAGPQSKAGRCASTVWWEGGCRSPGSGAWGAAPVRRWCRWAPAWRRARLRKPHLETHTERTNSHSWRACSCPCVDGIDAPGVGERCAVVLLQEINSKSDVSTQTPNFTLTKLIVSVKAESYR